MGTLPDGPCALMLEENTLDRAGWRLLMMEGWGPSLLTPELGSLKELAQSIDRARWDICLLIGSESFRIDGIRGGELAYLPELTQALHTLGCDMTGLPIVILDAGADFALYHVRHGDIVTDERYAALAPPSVRLLRKPFHTVGSEQEIRRHLQAEVAGNSE